MPKYYRGYIASDMQDFEHLLADKEYYSGGSLIEVKTIGYSFGRDYLLQHKKILTDFLCKELSNFYKSIKNHEIIDVLDKAFQDYIPKCHYHHQKIIFELVEDINGNIYGKEFHTGLYFLILTNQNLEKQYFLRERDKYEIDYKTLSRIDIRIEFAPKAKNIKKLATMISDFEVAKQSEITEYQKMFEKGFNKENRKRKYQERILDLYNKNEFNSEIILKTKKVEERISQNRETIEMENIEYLLSQLKKINEESYLEYQEKYENLLSSENITNTSLAMLAGEIEFELLFKKRNQTDITKYLENLKISYLEDLLNISKMEEDLTIKDLDKIEELFLKTKNKYTLLIQRKVLKDLAFLYLMYLIKNIDYLDTEVIEESYVKDNLKTIIIIIESLKSTGLIKDNLSIDLVADLTLNKVLDIIKNIEFNHIEKTAVNKLIKTIC